MTETHEQRVERLANRLRNSFRDARMPVALPLPDRRWLIEQLIASDREAGYVTVPADLLKYCADELEAWVRFAYPEYSWKYPSEARRYVRDMLPVARLRAAIAAHEQEERQDAP